MAIDLYLMIFSPPCRSVQMVAKQLNIDLNLKHIDYLNGEHLSPEFVKMNAAHCIPTINDNGFILWESRAIAKYLCNKYAPESELYPDEPKRRAIVDRMLDFDMGSLHHAINVGVIEPMRGISEPTEEHINALKNNLKLLDLFIGDNGYVAANHLTIADLSIIARASVLITAEYDLTNYPNVKAWIERMERLPYFDEINRKVIQQFREVLLEQTRKRIEQKNN